MKKIKEFIGDISTYLFARRRFAKINYFILDLVLKTLGIGNCKRHDGELWFSKYVAKNFKIRTIIDVGANIGTYAKMFYEIPGSKIYCFEPHPKTYERLVENTQSLKNIFTFNFGLSDEAGNYTLYDHADRQGTTSATLYKNIISELRDTSVDEFEIKLETLDDFVKNNNIENIDMLKMDVEGNELKILKGAVKTLSKFKIKIIHFEFNELNVYSRSFFKDFYDFLPDYMFYRLLPKGLLKLDYKVPRRVEIFAYQNIIAIRKENI